MFVRNLRSVILLLVVFFALTSCKKNSDTKILRDVQTQLTEITGDSLSNIQLTVAYGVVTLSGYINDESVKQKVENKVKETKHVKGVVNNLVVVPLDSVIDVQY